MGNSGAFYHAWVGGTSTSTLSDGVSRSTDNGHTFAFRGLAATCPGTTSCTTADQEHIAADRSNAASGGGDRVYNVWRDFAMTGSIRISCSTDGGANWTSGDVIGTGDFPRVSVGGDGFVYVAWALDDNVMFRKFGNCDAGLKPLGLPVTVASSANGTFSNVKCPVPGLDRCSRGTNLSSPKAAVDDNEDIMVYDSSDGGATFTRSVRVNNAVTARRFMPWISTYGGVALVSWYDRRTATPENNDLTRYFIGGAAVTGPYLVALQESDLSGVDDTQCSTGGIAPRAP